VAQGLKRLHSSQLLHQIDRCTVLCIEPLLSTVTLHRSWKSSVCFAALFLDDDIASAKDNRELTDTGENQLLSKDEIHSLRDQGFTGEASCFHPYAVNH